jgi:2,5-diketo-D-gluconate reductase A
MSTRAPTVALRHGATMPRLGLGTSPMDDRSAESSVAFALEAGYRLIDTAENYANERGVGRGLRASSVPREEVFVTTKFNKQWHGVDLVTEAYQRSLERLGLEYVDLLLIHWPNPDQDQYVAAWQGLGRLLEVGSVRAIGTSNFKSTHLQRIMDATGIQPDVNQVQLSPMLSRSAIREYDAQHGIVTEAWSPLGGLGPKVLSDPTIVELAKRYARTPAQIVLRWHMELGVVAVPRSTNPERIKQNIEVFDFQLTSSDMAQMTALDHGEDAAFDSDRFGH